MTTNEATLLQPVAAGIVAVSSGRLGSGLAAVVGLTGIIIGGLALARSTGRDRFPGGDGTGGGPVGAVVAMVLGLVGTLSGALVVATSDGGVGTGNGRGGAFVAIVLGLVALVTGGLARARAGARQVA
jgi:hypothetical protein